MRSASDQTLPRLCHRHLRQSCRVPPGERVLVAVSGGADSVALLRSLAELRGKRGWDLQLVVGHVQHYLRGEESELDAEFVRELARSLELPFCRRDVHLGAQETKGLFGDSPDAGSGRPSTNPPGLASESTGDSGPASARHDHESGLELRARKARHQALLAMAGEYHCPWIALGHHADDQLETMLMRLIRGAGLGGLSGMRWRRRSPEDPRKAGPATHAGQRPFLVRPLLSTPRAEIERYLQSLDQTWREDASNQQMFTWRNRLRAEVLPVLEALRSDVPTRASITAQQLADTQEWLALCARMICRQTRSAKHPQREIYDRKALAFTPKVVLSEMLRKQLTLAGARPDRLGYVRLMQIAHSVLDRAGHERLFKFAGGAQLLIKAGTMEIIPAKSPGTEPT